MKTALLFLCMCVLAILDLYAQTEQNPQSLPKNKIVLKTINNQQHPSSLNVKFSVKINNKEYKSNDDEISIPDNVFKDHKVDIVGLRFSADDLAIMKKIHRKSLDSLQSRERSLAELCAHPIIFKRD